MPLIQVNAITIINIPLYCSYPGLCCVTTVSQYNLRRVIRIHFKEM